MNRTPSALFAATLVFLAALAAYPASAGTQATPEITDPQYDQEEPANGVATCPVPPAMNVGTQCVGGRVDIFHVWIDGETATTLNVSIELSVAPDGPATATNQWDFHATPSDGTTDVVATVQAAATQGQTNTPPSAGANVASVTVTGTVLVMTINKSIYGNSTTSLKDLFVVGTAYAPDPVPITIITQDRAPDGTAFGAAYNYTIGSVPPCATCTPTDTDGDGLLDAWETEHFNDLNATGADDGDNDGLNNTREQTLGTNPASDDTDGDGYHDGAEVQNGFDPNDPASHPIDTTPTPTPTTTTDPIVDPADPTNENQEVRTLGEKLTADPAYLGIAAAGALVVLVLAFVGRFGRWGL